MKRRHASVALVVGLLCLTVDLSSCANKSASAASPGYTCTSTASPTLPSGSTAVSSPVRIPLIGCTLIDYSVPITIGGQANVNVIVDSGSTMLAVAASNCTNCTLITPKYPVSHGTPICPAVSSVYGDGTAWFAPTYQDTVQIGTLPTIYDNFGAILEQQNSFFGSGDCQLGNNGLNSSQGIMGLGYSALTEYPAVGFLDAAQDQLSMPDIFATQFCETGGNIWFGGYDASYTTGGVQYTPVTYQSYFNVTISDMKLGATSLGLSSGSYMNPLVDTGTSVGLLPPAAFNAIQSTLASNASFQSLVGGASAASTWFSDGIYCFTTAQTQAWIDAHLPTMTIVLPSTTNGQSITITLPASHSYLDYHTDTNSQVNYCPGIVPNSGSASDVTIIGGTLLRNLVTIFDRTNSRVGFATGTGCPN